MWRLEDNSRAPAPVYVKNSRNDAGQQYTFDKTDSLADDEIQDPLTRFDEAGDSDTQRAPPCACNESNS